VIWDATNGAHVRTLEGHTEGVNDITWSSDPMYLASGSDDYSVKIWNVQRVRAPHSHPIGCPLTASVDRESVSRPLQATQTTSSVSTSIPMGICWPVAVMMKQCRSGTSYKVNTHHRGFTQRLDQPRLWFQADTSKRFVHTRTL
jgi:WD40 repeat protein